MTQTQIAATLQESGTLSLVIDGEPVPPITTSHKNYAAILSALQEKRYDDVPDLLDVKSAVLRLLGDRVEIVDDQLTLDGQPMHGSLVDRVLSMVQSGLPVDHLLMFMDKLQNNPSYRSVEQLYTFLEHTNLPIAEDGRFLAYKWVRDNYLDCHTGTMDNSVGKVVSIPRNQVDDNPDNTCSNGLHVCSENYTTFGKRLMLVAVDPADVVSVPRDYNAAKMRVCEYEVLSELEHDGSRNYDKFGSDDEADCSFEDIFEPDEEQESTFRRYFGW